MIRGTPTDCIGVRIHGGAGERKIREGEKLPKKGGREECDGEHIRESVYGCGRMLRCAEVYIE